MCGIVCELNLDGKPVHLSSIKKMSNTIQHRGPDGNGHWVEDNIGIGHRRLSIIDLGIGGYQPMESADGRYILSFNGEIYNYRELRKELSTQGYCFNTNSDTEVLLCALIAWGRDAFLKFNGMFALVFWDRKEKRLWIARDRYGVKPLYYCFQNKKLLIASEQRAIVANDSFVQNMNKSALLEYFTFQNIFTDQTLNKDIHMLPHGVFGEFNSNTGNWFEERYWDYAFTEPTIQLSQEEYNEELDFLFRQAVKRQLVSDVEIGAYLSGGIDSGSVVSVAAKEIQSLKTFTIGFDLSSVSGLELAFDERQRARAMSSAFNTNHYENTLLSGDMEKSLYQVANSLEEPRVGQSYPNFYAAELSGSFVKVVLSGTGGDELFGGYPWRYFNAKNSQNFENYIDEYYKYWQRLIPNKMLKDAFAPIWPDVKNVWTRDIFRNVFENGFNNPKSEEDYINLSLYFEAKTFLTGLFMVEDKLSMAHGLESRVPFMDNDLVNFAMRCPVRQKLNQLPGGICIDENTVNKKDIYFNNTKDGKLILRRMIERQVPPEILYAPKQGFSSPDGSWFRGESISLVKEVLFNRKAKIYDFMDSKIIIKMIEEHLDGKENKRLLIWSLLNMETLLQNQNFN